MLVSSSDDDVLVLADDIFNHYEILQSMENKKIFFSFIMIFFIYRHILHLETRSFLFLSFEEFFLSFGF